MTNIIQYDLFEPRPTEVEILKMEMKGVRESCDKVRKKLFAENGKLKKDLYEGLERLEIIERNICRGATWKS